MVFGEGGFLDLLEDEGLDVCGCGGEHELFQVGGEISVSLLDGLEEGCGWVIH